MQLSQILLNDGTKVYSNPTWSKSLISLWQRKTIWQAIEPEEEEIVVDMDFKPSGQAVVTPGTGPVFVPSAYWSKVELWDLF